MNKNAGTADMSINADVMMYNGERRNNNNTGWVGYKTPTGQMFVRGAAYQESYTMKIANVGKDVQIGATSHKGTGSYGLMEGFKSIKADITFGSITAPSVRAENPSNEDWAAMTYTIDSLAKPYNYTARGYADTAAAYFGNQYVGTYIDTVSGRFTDQRAGVQSNAAGTMLIDNVLVTTCTVEDIKEVEVTGVYADTAHVEIQFNEEISGEVTDISGISLKKYAIDEVVALSAADFVAYGNTIRINKAIDRDTLYEVSLKKGFGTTVNTASADFTEIFTVKTLWYEDFETGTGADLVNTKIRMGTNNTKAYPLIKDGKLYSYSGFAPMADELKVYENATFTATTLLYKNLGHGDFATNYNKTIPYSFVAFNAKQLSINETSDLRWSTDNYGTRQFGWYLMNAGQRRYHNWVDDLVVVTPAEGTDYKAGDIVSNKSSSNSGKYTPSTKTGTVAGVGTVDFGHHYANTSHKEIIPGDAYYNSSTGEITVYKKGDALSGTYKKSNGTEVTTSESEAVPFEMTIEKQGSTGTLVFDGVPADTYKTAEEDMTKGYFGFGTQGIEIFGFEDMLITAYVKTNTVKEVTLDHADKYGVVIEGLTGEIPANFDGITIYDLNQKKNVEIKGGKSVDDSLFVEADLELNKPYKVTVKSKTAVGDDMYAGADYSEVFMVKEVFKVEPTVASIKQLNSGIGGPVANKIVQGDGFVALFGMTLKTPSYYNATIEAEIGYYADVPNGSPYIVNYFNHAGKTVKYTNSLGTEETTVGGFRLYISGSNNIRVNAANVIAEDEEYNESNVPFFKTNIPSGIYFGEYGCARHADPNNGSASSAWDGSIKKEIAPHTERYVMADDAYRLYVDNNPILSYKGNMNDSGYVQFGGSSRGLTKLYGVTVTQMEIIDKIALNVEDITADAKEIKVLFDQNVQGASDFSKVEVLEDGVKVNATFTTDEKELNIVPEGGIKSGAVYSVTVASGFGPSEICYTSEDASKNFKVTVYADVDFANGADDAVTFDGVVNYIDGAAAFTNGSMIVDSSDMAAASDYVVKYDYKHYAGLEIGGQYNNGAPASEVWFNRADADDTAGYSWNFGADSVVAKADNADVATVALTTKYGDALVDGSKITLLEKGANIEDYEIFIDDEIITEADRATVNYAFEVQKSNAGAALLRDGSLVHEFEVTDSDTTGYFGINASASDVIVIDNIQAYTFEEVTGVEIKLDVAGGKAIVTNYGEEAVDMVVVVAAYNNNNGMISSFKSLPITAGVGVTEVPYTLESTTGVKTYKAFAWDNLANLIPHCKAAVYEVK